LKVLPIKIYGEDILRRNAQDITNIDGELVEFLNSLIVTMKEAKGLGLAANQVGLAKRAYAVDLSYFDVVKSPLVIINPKIADTSGQTVMAEEGCLSFPGLYIEVERPEKATIVGIDKNGKDITIEASGLVARVFLHELDHLDGKLFIDHLSALQRGLIRGKLKKIKNGERV
jgi:peptide deformylase